MRIFFIGRYFLEVKYWTLVLIFSFQVDIFSTRDIWLGITYFLEIIEKSLHTVIQVLKTTGLKLWISR